MRYYHCFISMCPNNSKRNPKKVFIQVPFDETRRKQWFKIARSYDLSLKSRLFVCEDHFDLEHDMENYGMWKLHGGNKIMKKTAVPHKFDGLPNRNRGYSIGPGPVDVPETVPMKRMLVENILSEPSTSGITDFAIHSETEGSKENAMDVDEESIPESKLKIDVGTYVQATTSTVSKTCSPLKVFKTDVASSPKRKCRTQLIFQESSGLSLGTESFSSKSTNTYASTSTDESIKSNVEDFSHQIQTITMNKIKLNPRRYLGIPKECFFVIDLIKKYSSLDDISIFLTLKKIRCAHTFFELSDDFGISESTSSRIFSKSVVLIGKLMRELIIIPSLEKTKALLPIPFRKCYSNVQFIIDCWEIEINKPSDAVKQALTWSDYKKCNTIKYLVSCTPGGIVNFISKGFGGRASDATIVEESGFFNILSPGAVIMADRGFKHVEKFFIQKKCKLLRSPSVSTGQALSREQVLETKRIASLRIRVERVIRRLREFRMIKPHACIHSKLIGYMDYVVIIACGLSTYRIH